MVFSFRPLMARRSLEYLLWNKVSVRRLGTSLLNIKQTIYSGQFVSALLYIILKTFPSSIQSTFSKHYKNPLLTRWPRYAVYECLLVQYDFLHRREGNNVSFAINFGFKTSFKSSNWEINWADKQLWVSMLGLYAGYSHSCNTYLVPLQQESWIVPLQQESPF